MLEIAKKKEETINKLFINSDKVSNETLKKINF